MKDIVRRVGQRFMVGFEGLTASADVKALIREFGVAHVVLFARNVEEPVQLAELVRELQSVARDAGLSWPLLVAVDQEGEIHLGFDARAVFDIDAVDLLAGRAGLLGHQRAAEHAFGLFGGAAEGFGTEHCLAGGSGPLVLQGLNTGLLREVSLSVEPGETLSRTVEVFAVDHRAGLRSLQLAADPEMLTDTV